MTRSLLILFLMTAVAAAQETTPKDLDAWLELIRPRAEERTWREIPWRDQFGAAVTEARREKMPVLLWAMNGHPLGCT